MSGTILIIDDDLFLAEKIQALLQANGYDVRTAATGEEGTRMIAEEAPDLLVLDLGLPDTDGVRLCKEVRRKHRFPIVMLTSRADAIDKVVGLEVGADDYIPKPFEAAELVARVRAQLRRFKEYQDEGRRTRQRRVGPLLVDLDARTASVGERFLELTETEYQLVAYMAENVGRALSREMLFEAVWGYDIDFNSNSLDVFVYRLRSKIEAAGCPKVLHTIRGYGYKLQSLD